ncbi:MAG: hypothetical protein OXG88_11395 [Gammaproteobacteria bacterium]|nr:hypothetical protein [Gammaproteobacteria bacterium]
MGLTDGHKDAEPRASKQASYARQQASLFISLVGSSAAIALSEIFNTLITVLQPHRHVARQANGI